MKRGKRLGVIAFGVVLLLMACQPHGAKRVGSYGKPNEIEAISASPTSAGLVASSSTSSSKGSTAALADVGYLNLRLVDRAGGIPVGIPVEITGPKSGNYFSNDEGRVGFEGPPGYYSLKVVKGCFDVIQVLSGGSGRMGLVSDQVTTGDLWVDWRYRIAPSANVTFDPDEQREWIPQHRIEVSFDVIDRCSNRLAPGGDLGNFTYQLQHLRLTSEPSMDADVHGRAHVGIACESPGLAQLNLVANHYPADVWELFSHQSGPDPNCNES